MIHWAVQTVLLISFLLYLLHKYISRNFDYWEKRNVPFIKPKPFFGNFLDICLGKVDVGYHFANLYNERNDPFVGIFVFSRPVLMVRDPEILKNILVKDFDHFTDHIIYKSNFEPATAHMLFVERGEEWKTMRNKVSPIFSPYKLKTMAASIDAIAVNMKNYIEHMSQQKSLDAKELASKYSTDVIAKCAFAIDANSFKNQGGEFSGISAQIFDFRIITCVRFISYFFFHSIAKIFKLRMFDPRVIQFLRGVFWESIGIREKQDKLGHDLLDVIVDLRKDKEFCKAMNFDGDKVIAQAFMFFVAGFETVSSTIAFTLYEIGLNQEMQKKLRNNIRDTMKKHEGKLTYDAVADMDYLNMAIKETLRKYPALPFIDRECTSSYKIPGTDVVIEKGVAVVVPTVGLHLDPKFYPEPDKFIPERFENDKKDLSYLPFGKGPRGCVGERFGMLGTRLALVRILNEFEVHRMEDTPVPIIFEPRSLTLASAKGVPLKFKKSEPLF